MQLILTFNESSHVNLSCFLWCIHLKNGKWRYLADDENSDVGSSEESKSKRLRSSERFVFQQSCETDNLV